MPKIKNIIIFTIIATVLILTYVFFIKKSPEENNLVTSSGRVVSGASTNTEDSSITKEFLSILLSVKSIKLDDAVFADKAFTNLKDSSILLTSTGDEGRINPFAPIGSETATTPISPQNPSLN